MREKFSSGTIKPKQTDKKIIVNENSVLAFSGFKLIKLTRNKNYAIHKI